MFLVGYGVGVFSSGFLIGGSWPLQIGWGYYGGGSGSGSGSRGFGIGNGVFHETGLGVFEWEVVFFVVFESDFGGNKCIQCWWVSSQDGNVSRFCEFFFLDQDCLRKIMGCKSGV